MKLCLTVAIGGGSATLRQTFLTAIFYAQIIEKFVGEIPDFIESCRTAKNVSGNQKNTENSVQNFPCKKFAIYRLLGR
jgi:hypothetical protein